MLRVSATVNDYVDFGDMGNYDHSVQKNIDKKMSEFGMVPETPRDSRSLMTAQQDDSGTCDPGCVRSMEYLQRIVKSLMRQMRVHSHLFGPGEAITIDLQAELKYDDYVTLTKFTKSKQESDKYLYRIDEIMSNFMHVVEHSSSRFDFLENIIHLPAFYSLKFWIILLTSMVIGSLIVILFVKAFNTRAVHVQLLYGFLIIFIVSCVWSFSSLYEDKKAEIHTHLVQSNSLPPKDCDYNNMGPLDSVAYFFRVHVFKYKDQCSEYYATTMTDPFWKVNPMEAVSISVAFFVFKPLDYIGEKMGSFYMNFIGTAPLVMKPFMFGLAVLLTVLVFYGPFRISTPLLTIEPAWRPQVPALERHPVHQQHQAMIGHERVTRTEIMERSDGPVVKSVRDVTTDMDGFQEYLTDEGTDELEIIGPFARFKLEEESSKEPTSRNMSPSSSKELLVDKKVNMNISNSYYEGLSTSASGNVVVSKIEKIDPDHPDPDDNLHVTDASRIIIKNETKDVPPGDLTSTVKKEFVQCISLPDPNIKLVQEALLRDALEDPTDDESFILQENILP